VTIPEMFALMETGRLAHQNGDPEPSANEIQQPEGWHKMNGWIIENLQQALHKCQNQNRIAGRDG
jgi:hypothetical protein